MKGNMLVNVPQALPPNVAQFYAGNGQQQQITRQTLTLDNMASPFGCCNLFDMCTDSILSLSYLGTLPLLDWLGWVVTKDCYRSVEFINYMRPEQTGGVCTGGYIANPCDEPNGIEIGECKITVEDFGLIGRGGPTREVLKPERWCRTQPRYRLDGTLIESEFEWDAVHANGVMMDDLRRLVISGNAATPGQFDGLEQWVATDYDCTMLNSIVINWNQNSMAGGAGITWNGSAVGAAFNFVDVLLDAHRNVMDRMGWAPYLSNQMSRGVDMIIVGPSFLNRCLLDEFACWSVCPGAQYEEIVKNAQEIRQFRLTLNGGRFGHGRISLDGHAIDLLNFDYGLINSQNTGDMYLLTGQVGSARLWDGEILNAMDALAQLPEVTSAGSFFSRDGGRILGRITDSNLCYKLLLWMKMRLFCTAPWAQVRFQDVACAHPGPTISPDPCDTCFYPETCFTPAECP